MSEKQQFGSSCIGKPFRKLKLTALLVVLSALVMCSNVCLAAGAARTAGWRLVWHDEFEGPSGSPIDLAKWSFDVGGGGWGNDELQSYTSRTDNAKLQGGALVIQALKETLTGPDNLIRSYTSARLLTKTRFTQTYGRFEARIRVPYGQGIWPALWMLGNDIETAGWPSCGEIDIMENIGKEPAIVHGTLHGPGYSGANGLTATYELAKPRKFSDDYHTFAVEWEPDQIRFYVDGHHYKTQTRADLPPGNAWVFNHPFFLILNVAVGGRFPGNPDATTVFPQLMKVDYVRVYKRSTLQG